MTEKFKLARHQVYASEMMDSVPQLAIFYEAGCGKTMCALDWLYRSFKRKEIENALVICPASIVSSWQSSIDKMSKFEGYTRYGIEMMKKLVTVRSYQKTYEKKKTKVKHRNGEVEEMSVLKIRSDIRHEWGAIIVDESQGLGSASSTQTKIALQLAEFTDRRYIMTGTPVSGGGGAEDFKKLYGQLKFLDPTVFRNYKDFCLELVTKYNYYNQPCAYKVDECRALMKNYGIVARLNDCYDMPGIMDIPVPVELRSKAEYTAICKGQTDDLGFTIRTGGGFYIKLLELVSGFLLTESKTVHEYPTDKVGALEDIIASTDDKVVVFCTYTHSIDKAAEVCSKYGKTAIFDGRSKTDTWRDFQYGDAKYLVAHYKSGGVGIDLFAGHTTVFFEPSTSSLDVTQAKARTYRKGQTERCLYYWLVTKDTVEEKTADSVRNGVTVTTEMLEKWAKESRL